MKLFTSFRNSRLSTISGPPCPCAWRRSSARLWPSTAWSPARRPASRGWGCSYAETARPRRSSRVSSAPPGARVPCPAEKWERLFEIKALIYGRDFKFDRCVSGNIYAGGRSWTLKEKQTHERKVPWTCRSRACETCWAARCWRSRDPTRWSRSCSPKWSPAGRCAEGQRSGLARSDCRRAVSRHRAILRRGSSCWLPTKALWGYVRHLIM